MCTYPQNRPGVSGGQEIAGSNPVGPKERNPRGAKLRGFSFRVQLCQIFAPQLSQEGVQTYVRRIDIDSAFEALNSSGYGNDSRAFRRRSSYRTR